MTLHPVPPPTPSRRIRLIGCLAYPAGLAIVIGLALLIKSMV